MKHSPRQQEGQRWAARQRGCMARRPLAEQAVPRSQADKPGGITGARQTGNPGLQQGNEASNLSLKTPVGVAGSGEIPSLTGESVGETCRVLERTHTQPPGNQHQKGPICLWVVGEVTESLPRAEQVALFPLGPSPTYNVTTQPRGLPRPGEQLRLCPLYLTYEEPKKWPK